MSINSVVYLEIATDRTKSESNGPASTQQIPARSISTDLNNLFIRPIMRASSSMVQTTKFLIFKTSSLVATIFSSLMKRGSEFVKTIQDWKITRIIKGDATKIGQTEARSTDRDEVAEILMAEVGFTTATDEKPMIATYGCGPCVALGGYDPTNKIAFLAHFSSEREAEQCGELILSSISKLAAKKIIYPIQLHLRGGMAGRSEATIRAIEVWAKQSKGFPMEIASQEMTQLTQEDMAYLMANFNKERRPLGQSLLIDARNGKIRPYDPTLNPKRRDLRTIDIRRVLASGIIPNMQVIYPPSEKDTAR